MTDNIYSLEDLHHAFTRGWQGGYFFENADDADKTGEPQEWEIYKEVYLNSPEEKTS